MAEVVINKVHLVREMQAINAFVCAKLSHLSPMEFVGIVLLQQLEMILVLAQTQHIQQEPSVGALLLHTMQTASRYTNVRPLSGQQLKQLTL